MLLFQVPIAADYEPFPGCRGPMHFFCTEPFRATTSPHRMLLSTLQAEWLSFGLLLRQRPLQPHQWHLLLLPAAGSEGSAGNS
jgi:hypothetical protein